MTTCVTSSLVPVDEVYAAIASEKLSGLWLPGFQWAVHKAVSATWCSGSRRWPKFEQIPGARRGNGNRVCWQHGGHNPTQRSK